MPKVTFTVIKADIGGTPGHATVHPDLMDAAVEFLDPAVESGLLKDFLVTKVGDDMNLILVHEKGEDATEIHKLAYDCFLKGTEVAEALGLYGAGQDLLSDAFSGNVRGLGPGVAEMEFTRRTAEPVFVFMMDKTEPGAFNLPVYRMFGDPFNTPGLVIDPNMAKGFVFEVWDIKDHQKVFLSLPEDTYTLLALIGAKSRYVIKRVFPKKGHKLPHNEPVAVVSTEKLSEVAGEYVGKDDPVAVIRAQSGLPAGGEVTEPFAFPHLVSGWMRGSHNGPMMPVGIDDANCVRFDGPPRVVGLGFNVSPKHELTGPTDIFDDPAFERARTQAVEITDYLRRHGPFEPHRLPLEEMEYTTLPKILAALKGKWEALDKINVKIKPRAVGDVE